MSRYEIIFLSCLMVALWALMPITQMWDWDEPLYARTGIEMFLQGNLLLPRFNGEVFAHKPPFGYWLMGFAAQIFGPTEFAARFFSAPLLAFGALMVGRTAALMFDRAVGEVAMTILATSFMSVYLGAAAMMDAPLFAGYALSVWAFVKIVVQKKPSFALLALFSLGLLITLLVKGPVGPALIGGMVLGAFVFLPNGDRFAAATFFALFAAGLAALLAFLAWFIPANAASGGALLREGIGVHVIGRALAPMEGHGGRGVAGFLLFLPIYIPVIFLGMLPWSVALPGALGCVFRSLSARDRVILLAWFLPTFVAFSIAATKLPHYIFPTLAPLSVAIAVWVVQQKQVPGTASRIAAMLAYVAYAAGLLYAGHLFAGSVMVWKMALAAAIFVAVAVFAARATLNARTAAIWAAISLVMMQGFYWFALTEVDSLTKLSRAIGQQIHAQVPQDAMVINASYSEPSLIFYANRPVDNPITRVMPDQIAQTVAQMQTGYAVLTADELALLQQTPNLGLETNLSLVTLAQASAYNLNQSGLRQTVLLIKWQNSAPPPSAP